MKRAGVCRQRGVALIYVLLIFALVTVVASKTISVLWLQTEKNGIWLDYLQARQYALAVEQYVALLLEQDVEWDIKHRRRVDHLGEIWNAEDVPDLAEQAEVALMVVDESGYFNLNWLGHRALEGKRYEKMFELLLQNLGLSTQLLPAIQDWMDDNQELRYLGAEDDDYLLRDFPYRTSDRSLAAVSELKLIQGIGDDEYRALKPWVTALPGGNKLNVNTAPAEVLRLISERLTEWDADAIVRYREDEEYGFARLDELARVPELMDKTAELKMGALDFFSPFFSAYIFVDYRGTQFYLKTLFHRNEDGRVQAVSRETGPNEDWFDV